MQKGHFLLAKVVRVCCLRSKIIRQLYHCISHKKQFCNYSDLHRPSAHWLAAVATNNRDTKENQATKREWVGEKKAKSLHLWHSLYEGRVQLWDQITGHNSFDMSVWAVHDNVCRYLPEPQLHSGAHSFTLQPCYGERLYNVNTAMRCNTCHCLHKICVHHLQPCFEYAAD